MEEKPLIKNNYIDDYENSYKIINEKYQYYSNVFDKLSKIKTTIEKFLTEKLETINLIEDNLIISLVKVNYFQLISFIKDEMILNIKNSLIVVDDILKILSNIKQTIKSNIKNYSEFSNFLNSFNSKNAELQQYQTKYYNSVEKAESFTLDFLNKQMKNKEIEINVFEKKNKLQNNCKKDKEKYMSKIIEINEQIKELNIKQLNIFEINKNIEICCFDNYLKVLAMVYQYINEDPEGHEKRVIIKNNISEIYPKKEELNTFKYKERNKIKFIQYESKFDFNNCYDARELGLYIIVGEEMNNIIGEYIKDKINECQDKLELNAKIQKILNSDEKISEKDKIFIDSLLDTEKGRNAFIINLNNSRTIGNFQKSKKFCELIGKAINKLLDYERNNNDFSYIKNCIVLSQTYYYLDSKQNQIYISDLLLNNKLLNSPNFWREFTEVNIKKELNKVSCNKENEKEIISTQLLTLIKVLKDFKIDDRIIIKIIDEFLQKYDFSEQDDNKNIFIPINIDSNEIEKMRKEYQDNPKLENQLYPEDKNESN